MNCPAPTRALFAFLIVACVAFAGCEGSIDVTDGATSVWVAPASLDDLSEEHFYDHPWPSDVRREVDGTVRFKGFYNPLALPLIREYVTAATGLLDGFSPVATAYFRFTSPL